VPRVPQETSAVIMLIHHAVVLPQCCSGNISTSAGTPINVAGCNRRIVARSQAISGKVNGIAQFHQSGSQSGYGKLSILRLPAQ